ncbi:MAG: molybdopterin-dependent oxidoreductase [Chloroflexi bacterium]|nr:molybdopterin-dependent oxidoreductase [Chloroflexota bacterium]
MDRTDIRPSLPKHPVGPVSDTPARLRIDGLVERPLTLSLADLAALPRHDLTAEFACLEGWTVPDVAWQGVPVEAILEAARLLPEAAWIQASARDFSVPLPLDVARQGMLALYLDGQPLPTEHGGPVRLVVPGQDCYTSIKWLDHLTLLSVAGQNTGRTTALGRLPATAAE